MKHVKSYNESIDNEGSYYSRDEMIELLSTSSTFEKEDLEDMDDEQLKELWRSLEMDSWLDELEID